MGLSFHWPERWALSEYREPSKGFAQELESSNEASDRHSVITGEAGRRPCHSLSRKAVSVMKPDCLWFFHVAILNLHALIAELNGEASCPGFEKHT